MPSLCRDDRLTLPGGTHACQAFFGHQATDAAQHEDVQNIDDGINLAYRFQYFKDCRARSSTEDAAYDEHTAHLEMPHWLEPIVPGERVSQAYSRLVAGSLGILCGTPLTRPIVSTMPTNPLASAKDSVNRGGCTFILNHRALTVSPVTSKPASQGRK